MILSLIIDDVSCGTEINVSAQLSAGDDDKLGIKFTDSEDVHSIIFDLLAMLNLNGDITEGQKAKIFGILKGDGE